MKLKQTLEEHETRFTKLEYDVSIIKEDKNIIPISEEVAISPEINSDRGKAYPMSQRDAPTGLLRNNTPTKFISPLIESQSEEEKVIISDPMPEHNSTQVQRSESKSLSEGQDIIDDDTAETLDFVETVYKESVSKEIMERIRKKKMRDQNPSLDSTLSNVSCNLKSSEINTTIETTQLEPSPIDQVQSNITSESGAHALERHSLRSCSTIIKIPYNQKVEQGLMGELSGCGNSKENIAIQDVDIQIPNLPLVLVLETILILIGFDEVTAEIIV